MRSKSMYVLLSMVMLLAAGAVVYVSVSAAEEKEAEAPFWKANEKRLAKGESKEVSLKGKEASIDSRLLEREAEIRCKKLEAEKALIEGSETKEDGQGKGILRLSECALWVNEGGGLKERKECEVKTITTNTLNAKLWYEGKLGVGKEPVTVFEPPSKEVAKITIAKFISKCPFEGTYTLEGEFAAKVGSLNKESKELTFNLPKPAISPVWQPQFGGHEKPVALKLNGVAATLQAEALLTLTAGGIFSVNN